jgi:hypothetical protein
MSMLKVARLAVVGLGYLCSFLSYSLRAAPEGGALPRGKPLKQGVSRPDVIVEKAEKQESAKSSCAGDFAGPPGGHGAFDKKSLHLFYMTNAGKQGGQASRYVLYDIDLAEKKATRKAALTLPESHVLLAYGSPVRGVSALYFDETDQNCETRKASLLTVMTEEVLDQKQQAAKVVGQFSVVDSDNQSFLFDAKKRMIMETDVSSFQMRAFAPAAVPAGDIPLFVDSRTRSFVTWRRTSKVRGLVHFQGGKETQHLKLEDNDKLAWRGGGLAAISFSDEKNSLDIQELATDLSGKSGEKTSLTLLPVFPARMAEISLNHGKKLAAIEGATLATRLSWRQSFLFDYKAGKEITSATPAPGHYIFQSFVSPDGAWFVAEERDEKSHETTAIKLFQVAAKKWTDVKIFAQPAKK